MLNDGDMIPFEEIKPGDMFSTTYDPVTVYIMTNAFSGAHARQCVDLTRTPGLVQYIGEPHRVAFIFRKMKLVHA